MLDRTTKEKQLRIEIQPEPIPVYVRSHTRVKGEKPRRVGEGKLADKWAHYALVFDCETTTDISQDLNFLWWRFCERKQDTYVCQQEGLVYADAVDAGSIALIRKYAKTRRADVEDGCPEDILVQSRTEFVDGEFWTAAQAGAVIVCFNAPFDLSRLAVEYREARKKNSGWSMVLWRYQGKPDKLRPKLRIKPKDSRSAFISFAGGDPNNRTIYRGRFLDLSVLGWALRNRHMTLEGFLKSFGLEGKIDHEPTGRVTEKELAYGRRDTERTVALLNAMKREYDGFPIDLPPERAMSAASITKAFLDKMKVEQPSGKFDLPNHILGKTMQAYYGGRSEIRIRHQEVPIVVCDTTSEYPSVAGLLRLWPLLTAASGEVEECTKEARHILDGVNADSILDPSLWPRLGFFASVKPLGDLLPVRAMYSETGETNIGLNPLTATDPIWYAGPDLAASRLASDVTPQIVEAFRIVPKGVQAGMKMTAIGTRTINPVTDDFFRVVIEERKNLPKSHPHYLLLKIIANALYGIFAELNKEEFGKNNRKQLEVFSGEYKFNQPTFSVERPGRWQFPPAAALITAGGRLMLAILERMVRDLGGTYLLTDTDSMFFVASEKGGLCPCPGGQYKLKNGTPAAKAITWKQVDALCAKLNSLNPYDPNIVSDILKVEDSNYARNGNQHQLFGLAVSAKRYVVYARTKKKNNVEIIKPSEHGLGIVFVPDKRSRYTPMDCKDQETSYPLWIVETWERLLSQHFKSDRDPENALLSRQLWFDDLPVVMRVRITTPNVLKALRKRNPEVAKPYNFALSPILVQPSADCTLVAPASKDAADWLTREYTEIHTGDVVKLGSEYKGKTLTPQILSSVIWRHFLHPEDKSLSPDGQLCNAYTRGLLLRRPVAAISPLIPIGKEIERKSQEGEDISVLDNVGPVRYHPRKTANTRPADAALIQRASRFPKKLLGRESGVSQHAIDRFLDGERIHPGTRLRLAQAVEKLENRDL
ncbi:MAG: hypothetical protein ACJ72H_29435 [Candidatus Sulfotelmatobacter sp.]|jgi:hypothetical protein